MRSIASTCADQDQSDPEGPAYAPLRRAMEEDTPQRRRMEAGSLQIELEFRAPWADVRRMQTVLAGPNREALLARTEVLVMERSDGWLWVYEGAALVEAAQRIDPAMPVACAIYRDPTR
jgi:hypothetical protein